MTHEEMQTAAEDLKPLFMIAAKDRLKAYPIPDTGPTEERLNGL
jgi:hypothetical protein